MANLGAWLWNRGQPIAAALAMGLLLLTFIFFYLRWFPAADTSGASPGPGGCGSPAASPARTTSFPPIINLCPDFMVVWTDTAKNTHCVDINNTYDMLQYNGAGQTPVVINGADSFGYPMSTLKSYFSNNTASPTITDDAKGKYIRWEGVWDGMTCISGNIPK